MDINMAAAESQCRSGEECYLSSAMFYSVISPKFFFWLLTPSPQHTTTTTTTHVVNNNNYLLHYYHSSLFLIPIFVNSTLTINLHTTLRSIFQATLPKHITTKSSPHLLNKLFTNLPFLNQSSIRMINMCPW